MEYGTNNTPHERSRETGSRVIVKWLEYKDGKSALAKTISNENMEKQMANTVIFSFYFFLFSASVHTRETKNWNRL